MLFKEPYLDALATGEIDLAFRRWDRPRVKVGTRLRTSHGVVEVVAIDEVPMQAITQTEAARAGVESLAELVEMLERREHGSVYRIELRLAGDDPRVALRQRADLSPDELADVRARLARLDRASRHGAWTLQVLRLIADRPAVLAARLAATMGRERLAFKRDVRKLKELGLTESLEIGYRLSPRGAAVLAAIVAESGDAP